jgi:hypothetical protein
MKIFLFGLVIGIVLANAAIAQDSLVIPKGVVYKKAGDELNNEIKELFLKELSATTVTYSLFKGVVFCGPQLWQRYKKNEKIAAIQQGNVTFHVPLFDDAGKVTKTVLLEGKLIQQTNDFKLIWDEIIKDFSTSPVKIRKLTPRELSYYWSIISFDIQEPIFVAENNSYKIILDSGGQKKLIFMEQL